MHPIRKYGKKFLHYKTLDQVENDKTICFFRFQSLADSECAYDALLKHCVVFIDISGMPLEETLRFKYYMKGVCISLHAHSREICDDYVTYFPSEYLLQIFES